MAANLHVLIVGAGISGLMCGALLEKANISYDVCIQHPIVCLDRTDPYTIATPLTIFPE